MFGHPGVIFLGPIEQKAPCLVGRVGQSFWDGGSIRDVANISLQCPCMSCCVLEQAHAGVSLTTIEQLYICMMIEGYLWVDPPNSRKILDAINRFIEFSSCGLLIIK